jgi:hypothetical protein
MPVVESVNFIAQANALSTGQFALLASSAAALYVSLRFAARATSSDQPDRVWISSWPVLAVCVAMVLMGREQGAVLLCLASSAAALSIGLAVPVWSGLPACTVSRRVIRLLPVLVIALLTLRLQKVELIHATALLVMGVVCAWGDRSSARPAWVKDIVSIVLTAMAVGFGGVALWILDSQYRVPSDTVLAVFILAPICAMVLVMDELHRSQDLPKVVSEDRSDAAISFSIRMSGIALPVVLLIAAVRPRLKTWVDLPEWFIVQTSLALPPNGLRFFPLMIGIAVLLMIYRWRSGSIGKLEGLFLIAGYVATLLWSLA